MLKWLFVFLWIPFYGLSQSQTDGIVESATLTNAVSQRFVTNLNLVQDDELWLGIKEKNGFLAAHRGVMSHLPDERITGVEISLRKRLGATKNWHYFYKYPYVGVTFYGSTVGNNAILGQAFGSYAFIEFPMNRGTRHILSAKLGSGLGYITKVFDQETNPKNVAISTHVNALICLGIEGKINIGERHQLNYSFDLTHLSNGATKVPNLGLNMPNFGIGYSYKLRAENKTMRKPVYVRIQKSFARNWKTHVMGILSVKEVFPTNEKKYPVYAISLQERKLFRPKVGMEVAFDVISKQAVFGYKRYIPKTQWSILQMGIFVGYVLPLDHLQFVIGMGKYVKDRYDPDGQFYHRVGMRYQFDNGITANLVLKSHWAKADYIEYGVGYTFHYKSRKANLGTISLDF